MNGAPTGPGETWAPDPVIDHLLRCHYAAQRIHNAELAGTPITVRGVHRILGEVAPAEFAALVEHALKTAAARRRSET